MDLNHFLSLVPKLEMIAISNDSLFIAQEQVIGCEACDPAATRHFSAILDQVTDRDAGTADYILAEPAECGKCGSPVMESTLVSVADTEFSPACAYTDTLLEGANLFLIDEPLLREAEEWIGSCEQCSERAEYSFDQLLDSLTGCDPTQTEYLMLREAQCPRCQSHINEKTLISPD